MANLKTFPQAPYHDDFDVKKNFARVLFRPGLDVQVREMNQLQSILQNQIGSISDYVIENGSKVIKGETVLRKNFEYIKISGLLARSLDSEYINTTIKNATNTINALIVHVVRNENSDPDTLYIQYKTSDSTTNAQRFLTSDSLTITFADGSTEIISVGESVDSVGTGVAVLQNDGIFYNNSQFIFIDKQTLILSKYGSIDSIDEISVGFDLTHSIVTSDTDSSLLDNSTGTPNQTAPGANRYKVVANLVRKSTLTDISNYVEILSIQLGEIVYKARKNDSSVLQDILAKRTYDESGNYVVDDFVIDVREHLNDGTNRGLYTTGNETKLGIILDQGSAYVQGYNITTTSNTYLETDKARDTLKANNVLISNVYTSYFTLSGVTTLPTILQKINLKNGSTIIGNAVVKSVYYVSAGVYRLEFANISINSGSAINNVTSVDQTAYGTAFTATVSSYTYNARQSRQVFQIPYGYVKSLDSSFYYYYKEFSGFASGSTLSLTCASDEQFTTTISDYVLHIPKTSSVVGLPDAIDVSTNNQQININIASYAFTQGVTPIRVIARIAKTNGSIRTKSLTAITETISAASVMTLTKCDVANIISITQGTVDYTNFYSLDNGQRDSFYDVGKLTLKPEYSLPTGTLTIQYNYFLHSNGDFFAPQSYENVSYKNIPSYKDSFGNTLFLGSCLDFRVKKLSDGSFEKVGAHSFQSGGEVLSTFQYYASRIDRIALNKKGEFVITKGVPSGTPKAPDELSNAITLYDLFVPAYTFSTQDVIATKHFYRRFTMKDITDLSQRVDDLEKTVYLSNLENKVANQSFPGSFKSGFIVDDFTTQFGADINANGYNATLDVVNNLATCPIATKNVQLKEIDTNNTTLQVTNNLATLPYIKTPVITQLLASSVERLQPFTLSAWEGDLALIPPIDVWFSQEVRPDIINSNVGGSVWNRWRNLQAFVETGTVRINSQSVSITSQTNAIPFIRNRLVQFTGSGFKPNTIVHAFFDGVLVDSFCYPSGSSTQGTPLVTSPTGSVNGFFNIPNNSTIRFRTGQRNFVLIDTDTLNKNYQTIGSAVYTANGNVEVIQRVVNQNVSFIFPPNSDPVAQSFSVASPETIGGCFVASIEVFFGVTTGNTFPVILEIREMDNGYPTLTVVKNASVVLSASSIIGSSDASIATEFTFKQPIFLEETKEYCFVLRSNSEKLTVWQAVLGQRSILTGDSSVATGQIISKQPYIGTMFTSSNNSTWTAEQTRDLKFRINRCKFTSLSGALIAKNKISTNDVNTEANEYSTLLEENPFEMTATSDVLYVFQEGHSFRVGDKVVFFGNGTGTINGVPYSEIYNPLGLTVISIDSFGYSVQMTSIVINSGRFGGTGQYVKDYIEFESFYLKSLTNNYVGCSVDYEYKGTIVNANAQDQNWIPISNMSLVYLQQSKRVLASGDGRFQARISLKSDRNNLSPTVDLNGLSLVSRKNIINSTTESLTENTGNIARYVQKEIKLDVPANQISVFIECNRPSNTDIEVYYKKGQQSVSESNWVKIPLASALPYTEDRTKFNEAKWYVGNVGGFYVCQIKIVLKSTDTTRTPSIKNLRTILLNDGTST